MNKHFTYKFVI